MSLYEVQYSRSTGSVVRSEEYWRWMIGRRYAHVIWVACLGDAVKGYAFIKDHKILEIAFDPAYPQALKALLGRVRAEALERAYPEVSVAAPANHPVIEAIRTASGRLIDQDVHDGSASMYHIPDTGEFLKAVLPELARRAADAKTPLPLELGITTDTERYMLHIQGKQSRVERDKLSRRHLSLSAPAMVRLLMGQSGIEAAADDQSFVASTSTALEAARILFPPEPIWRSPLDGGTA
jgi:hypothetical protein